MQNKTRPCGRGSQVMAMINNNNKDDRWQTNQDVITLFPDMINAELDKFYHNIYLRGNSYYA